MPSSHGRFDRHQSFAEAFSIPRAGQRVTGSLSLDRCAASSDSESQVEKQLSVDQLSVGMFVSDLDRPWLDTPFLVQGFLIEDESTIAQLRQMCRHVTVDLSRSIVDDGKHPTTRAQPAVPTREKQEVVRVVATPLPTRQRRTQPRSLLRRWLEGLVALRDSAEQQTADTPGTVRRPAAPAGHSPVEVVDPPSKVRTAARTVNVKEVAPAVPAHGGRPEGVALGACGDLFSWLRERLDRIRVSSPGRGHAAGDARGPSEASRLRRSAPVIRIYQDSGPVEPELERANESFGRAIDMLGTVIRDIQVGKGLEIEAVESVVEDLVESIIHHPGALQLVSRMREADESAYTHALQVAVLLVSFGRELGFSRTELTQLGQVGMLLDVGKLRIDPRILSKRGNLTAEEFDEVKRHVQYGLDIIASSAVAHPDVIAGVAQHHERLNGTGYPRGLRDADLVPVGQMAGIVDAFAALTSVRPYADPISPYAAMQQLQSWGDTYFNSSLVEQFVQAIGIFPVGTLVELSTGEVGVVLEQNRTRRLKPKVLVISAPDKTPLEIPVTLDLLYGGGAAAHRVPYIRQGLPNSSLAVDAQEYYLSRS
jgi:HD-GYP domain-containing protein (c-di-GMP phosphodiesterase class II)